MKNITASLFYLPLLSILLISSLGPSFDFLHGFNRYDEKRLFQISAITLLGICSLLLTEVRNSVYTTLRTIPFTSRLAITVFFTLGIISALFSESPRHSFIEISLLFLLFLTSLYIASAITRNTITTSEWLMTTFVFAIALHFAAFLSQFIMVLQGRIEPSSAGLFTGFLNPRFENQWEGMILPIIIGTAIYYKKQSLKVFYITLFLSAFIWMNILFSSGRGVVIATFTGVLLTGILFKAHRKIWWELNLSVLASGIVLYVLAIFVIYLATGTYMLAHQEFIDSTSAGRLTLWLSALELTNLNPFIGIGPIQFSQLDQNEIAAHPHNIILQLLVEWGVIAMLLAVAITSYGFIKWISFSTDKIKTNPESTILYSALTSSFITGNLHALVSGVWVMPLSQLTLIIIIGWMYGLYRQEDTDIKPASKPYVFVVLILIVLTTFIYSLYPELSNLANWIQTSFEATGYSMLHPRFWSQGNIL